MSTWGIVNSIPPILKIMIKEYKINDLAKLNNAKQTITINLSSFSNNTYKSIKSKNSAFNFEYYISNSFQLPDGYYDKPYPTATIYNEISPAPITPYQIRYETNIYNYLNSYCVIYENTDIVNNLEVNTINTIYYGDIIEYNNNTYLLYGFNINYQNSIETKEITTINGSGFSLNPNGNRYNTISYEISNYNPLFFYNTNALNDYYYYNSEQETMVLASPTVNSDPLLGSYEINSNYAYFKDYLNADGTITFNPEPIIYTNENNYSYQWQFTNLQDYYVGNNYNIENYKFGFIGANTEDTVFNSEYGTQYNYFYNYTNIIKDQQFIFYSDIQKFQNNIQEPNNNVYLNTTTKVPLNDNNYIYNETYPTFNPLNLTNKLVSTNNIELELKTINLNTLYQETNTTIQPGDVFENMQGINLGGITIGALLSAMITFTLLVSLLKLGR